MTAASETASVYIWVASAQNANCAIFYDPLQVDNKDQLSVLSLEDIGPRKPLLLLGDFATQRPLAFSRDHIGLTAEALVGHVGGMVDPPPVTGDVLQSRLRIVEHFMSQGNLNQAEAEFLAWHTAESEVGTYHEG